MIAHLAALLVPSALYLAAHADTDRAVTYTCRFERGVIVIDQSDPAGAVMVEIDGEARRYAFDQQKLVPKDPGMPTYYFQTELKRWKLLNNNGETVETTVCKASLSTTAARPVGSNRE